MAAETIKEKKRKKKLTLGRPALVTGTQQTLSNLFWRLSISMVHTLIELLVNLPSDIYFKC
jgi:hypothetical protein